MTDALKEEYDVIVVGGSFAGLSAATGLARVTKNVLVVDGGKNRNRFANHAHNVLGHDHKQPHEILSEAREQYKRYAPFAQLLLESNVSSIVQEEGNKLCVTVMDSHNQEHVLKATKVVLATGVVDTIPSEPLGLVDNWGRGVAHCPHCAGFEFRTQRLGILHRFPFPIAAIYATMVAELTTKDKLVYFTNGLALKDDEMAPLQALGFTIETEPIQSIVGKTGETEEGLKEVVLKESGRQIPIDLLYYPPSYALPQLVVEMGLETVPGAFGMDQIIKCDPETRLTSMPGVYAAGDCASQMQQIVNATFSGFSTAVQIHVALMMGK